MNEVETWMQQVVYNPIDGTRYLSYGQTHKHEIIDGIISAMHTKSIHDIIPATIFCIELGLLQYDIFGYMIGSSKTSIASNDVRDLLDNLKNKRMKLDKDKQLLIPFRQVGRSLRGYPTEELIRLGISLHDEAEDLGAYARSTLSEITEDVYSAIKAERIVIGSSNRRLREVLSKK